MKTSTKNSKAAFTAASTILKSLIELGDTSSPAITLHTGYSVRTVQRWGNQLEKLGLIENISQSELAKIWHYTGAVPIFNIGGLKLNPPQLVKFLEKYHGLDIRLEQ